VHRAGPTTSRSARRRPAPRAVAVAALALTVARAAAPETPPAPTTLRDVVRGLVGEARAVLAGTRAMPDAADLAARPVRPPAADDVLRAIARPQHRDPFVDAYVRWHLASVAPPLAALDDEAFLDLLRGLPPLLDNPRAAPDLVARLRRAGLAGPLSRRDRDRLAADLETTDARCGQARGRNGAGDGLRLRLAERAGRTGPRPRLLLLEHCAATIAAGWPPAAIKRDLTASFADAAADPDLDAARRRRLVAVTDRLAGRRRTIVNHVTFFADGSVRARFGTAQVSRADVRRWTAPIRGDG
jgi:hypothetical protein